MMNPSHQDASDEDNEDYPDEAFVQFLEELEATDTDSDHESGTERGDLSETDESEGVSGDSKDAHYIFWVPSSLLQQQGTMHHGLTDEHKEGKGGYSIFLSETCLIQMVLTLLLIYFAIDNREEIISTLPDVLGNREDVRDAILQNALAYGKADTGKPRKRVLEKIAQDIQKILEADFLASDNCGHASNHQEEAESAAMYAESLASDASRSQFEMVEVKQSIAHDLIKNILQQKFETHPSAHDVILGRGQPIRDLEGNLAYRRLIDSRFPSYMAAERHEQPRLECSRIVNAVVATIRAKGGRFLVPFDKLNPRGGGCMVVDAKTARFKINHALRDQKRKLLRQRKAQEVSEPSS